MRQQVFEHLKNNKQTLALVESCTGGGLCRDFVIIAGASEVLRGSLVAYQDFSKTNCLSIAQSLIDKHTSVSKEVALEMSKKGAAFFQSDICLSTTGWAGPGGGTDADPVGTVYFAVCGEGFELVERRTFKGCNGRASLMESANEFAWEFLAKALSLKA